MEDDVEGRVEVGDVLVAAVVVGDGVWQVPVLELERVDVSAESAAEEQEPKRVVDEDGMEPSPP